jgi:CO dehydrogenase maturation factor
MAREFVRRGGVPVLAVDADPNSNLGDLLGMKYEETISDVRDELRDESKIPPGTSKGDYVNVRLNEIIVEGNGIDLIAMGRPEGRECYCYVNEMLRGFLTKLAKNYKIAIIDNEAGMEHLSRRTTDNVDALLIIAEPTAVSMKAAERIFETSKKIRLKIDRTYLVMNRTDKPPGALPCFAGLELLGAIPYDSKVAETSEVGEPVTTVPVDSPAATAVKGIIDNLMLRRPLEADRTGQSPKEQSCEAGQLPTKEFRGAVPGY